MIVINHSDRRVCAIVSPNVRPKRNDPQDQVRCNEQIRSREVRVIGAEGEQLGILGRNEAIASAKELGLDLVEVAATAEPPVCRIMDYGKFKYETQKKKQDAKKRQTVFQIKEIKLRPKTDEHDYLTKVGHIRRFLTVGDRCKVTIYFRGREIVHKDRGQVMLDRVVEDTKDLAKIDQEARAEGRTLHMMLAPLPKK
ncbi:translation initiation factor IF-3 [Deltaproteobacteria bacterium]|nr:translation initiation factor IF-3 [Deltaproteobacteria bacterium]